MHWPLRSLGPITGRAGDPWGQGSALYAGKHAGSGLQEDAVRLQDAAFTQEVKSALHSAFGVQFTLVSYPCLRKFFWQAQARGLAVFCWKGHYMPEFFQECAFLLFTEAEVIDVVEGDFSPSLLGWVMMPTLPLQSPSRACRVSAKYDFQYFFSDHTSELIPPTSVSLTPNGSCQCSSDKMLQQFPHFQDYAERVHSWKSVFCC